MMPPRQLGCFPPRGSPAAQLIVGAAAMIGGVCESGGGGRRTAK